MHARELVELATIVSAHGPVLVESGLAIPAESLEQYWVASKIRLDRWSRLLRATAQQALQSGVEKVRPAEIYGTLEEVLSGEVLTRVWAAVLAAHDRHLCIDQSEPVARSVMIGHIEARHRALSLLAQGRVVDQEMTVKLERLRRRAERWTDLLVGHLAGRYQVGEFALDPRRARGFAADFRQRGDREPNSQAWRLLTASSRAAFQPVIVPVSPNAELNARIAASVLACFAADVFDSTGLLRSMWLMRMMDAAEDTQMLLEDILGQENIEARLSRPHRYFPPTPRR